jgi:hypothetical protein
MAEFFDRITYHCPKCLVPGIIDAAWVSLTVILLEGECPHCGIRSARRFDLLDIDQVSEERDAGSVRYLFAYFNLK